jgi:hypothetical protein
MLGLGRAFGETMAVTMVIGNNPKMSLSLFAPQYTMAAVIANEFTEAANELHISALIEIGLVLFIVTFAINAASRLLIWGMTHQKKQTVAVPANAEPAHLAAEVHVASHEWPVSFCGSDFPCSSGIYPVLCHFAGYQFPEPGFLYPSSAACW